LDSHRLASLSSDVVLLQKQVDALNKSMDDLVKALNVIGPVWLRSFMIVGIWWGVLSFNDDGV